MEGKGYIQIYTGNGKGKTTAAFGLALRAVCYGYQVLILQFLKGQEVAELKAADYLPGLTIRQFGLDHFVVGQPSEEDRAIARRGIGAAREAMKEGKYDMVILDEVNNAVDLGLVDLEELVGLMESKPERMELVLTGRNARQQLVERADLVTEMRPIKHYYDQGVMARKGIEY